jgi:putative ABC transport system substrate-binding protein
MRRREFITVLCGVASAWPLVVRAQQSERMKRVGLLVGYSEDDTQGQASVAAFRQKVRELGWTEDGNVLIDTRWAGSDPDKARAFAKELVGMRPDVIVTSSNLVTEIVQRETRTVPIVFVFVGDPVGSGFVTNVARPDGNLTGFPVFETAIAGKWVRYSTKLRRTSVVSGSWCIWKPSRTLPSCVQPKLPHHHSTSS